MTLPVSGFSYSNQNFTVTKTSAQAVQSDYIISLTPPPGVNPVFITRIDISRSFATQGDYFYTYLDYFTNTHPTLIGNHIDQDVGSLTQNVLSITPFDYILFPGQNPTLSISTNAEGDITPVIIDVNIQYKTFNTSLQLNNDYQIYFNADTEIASGGILSLLNNNSAYPYVINQILVTLNPSTLAVGGVTFNLLNSSVSSNPNNGFYSGTVNWPTMNQSIVLGDYVLMPGETISISNLYADPTTFNVTINYEVVKNN